MGRLDCFYTKQIIKFLKKNFTNVKIFLSKDFRSKPNKDILNWKGDYIFCFRSYYILKKKLINNTKNYAINFHPGPPEYRGIGGVNFAILKDEKKFGCTSHLIDEEIDHGKILNVIRFKISKKDTIESILNKTYKFQYAQILKILKSVLKNSFEEKYIRSKKNLKWKKIKYNRKQMLKLYNIPKKLEYKKFVKLIRATNTKKFKPYIKIFNKKFYLNE